MRKPHAAGEQILLERDKLLAFLNVPLAEFQRSRKSFGNVLQTHFLSGRGWMNEARARAASPRCGVVRQFLQPCFCRARTFHRRRADGEDWKCTRTWWCGRVDLRLDSVAASAVPARVARVRGTAGIVIARRHALAVRWMPAMAARISPDSRASSPHTIAL